MLGLIAPALAATGKIPRPLGTKKVIGGRPVLLLSTAESLDRRVPRRRGPALDGRAVRAGLLPRRSAIRRSKAFLDRFIAAFGRAPGFTRGVRVRRRAARGGRGRRGPCGPRGDARHGRARRADRRDPVRRGPPPRRSRRDLHGRRGDRRRVRDPRREVTRGEPPVAVAGTGRGTHAAWQPPLGVGNRLIAALDAPDARRGRALVERARRRPELDQDRPRAVLRRGPRDRQRPRRARAVGDARPQAARHPRDRRARDRAGRRRSAPACSRSTPAAAARCSRPRSRRAGRRCASSRSPC